MNPLAPYPYSDALADDEVQMRSLRQFGFALAVGLVIFFVVGLIEAPSAGPVATAVDRTIAPANAPHCPAG
jgi:hypothetical protein